MKKLLIILGAVSAVLFFAAAAFVYFVDMDSYRQTIESAVSGAIGMEVSINGRMGLTLQPFLGVGLDDLRVRNRGEELLSVRKVRISVELLPLLRKELRVEELELVKPVLSIVKDSKGRFNFESDPAKKDDDDNKDEAAGTAALLTVLRVSDGTITYLDRGSGEKTEFKGLTAVIRDLALDPAEKEVLKAVSFTGELRCSEARKGALAITNIETPISAGKGVFELKPVSMDIFGGKGDAGITADMRKPALSFGVRFAARKFRMDRLLEAFGTNKYLGGEADMTLNLATKGRDAASMKANLNGDFSLRGENLAVYSMDIDQVLSKIEETQKFNLVDVGAFLLTGPLGTAALSGYRYGSVYMEAQGGRGEMKKLVADWKIRNGVAETIDCAFSTPRNRVAMKGRLDLVRERYEGMEVAALDAKGCARFSQKLSGPFGSPQIGAVSTVQSLTAPIFDLFRKAKQAVLPGSCSVFYNGTVQHPKEQ